MQKNVSGQKFRVFAFDATTNLPKSGDAANITAYISKDFGAVTALGDTSATEEDATNAKGYYLFDGTQAETNADIINVTAKSSTSNIVVIGAPAAVVTTPANFSALTISGGKVPATVAAGDLAAAAIDATNFTDAAWEGLAPFVVVTGPATAGGLSVVDTYRFVGLTNGLPAFKSATLGTTFYLWSNGTTWFISTVNGTAGTNYWQSNDQRVGSAYAAHGTTTGAAVAKVGQRWVDVEAMAGTRVSAQGGINFEAVWDNAGQNSNLSLAMLYNVANDYGNGAWAVNISGQTTKLPATVAAGDAADLTTLLGRLSSARAGYLDNLNVGGAVASHADVLAINTSSSKHLILATVGQYERPESGTVTFQIEARTFAATDGSAVNADSTPTLTATGLISGSLAANLSAATNPATGVYRWTYTVSSAATVEQIRLDLSAVIGGSTFTLPCYTQVCDLVSATVTATDLAHLTAIYNKLPSASYLAGTANSSGAVQASTMTGNFPGSVASVAGDVHGDLFGDVHGRVLGGGSTYFTGTGVIAVGATSLQPQDAPGVVISPASTALSTATWTNARAAKIDNLADTLELNAGHYRFTVAALFNAPAGGGGGGSNVLAANGLDNVILESGINARQGLSLILAEAAGDRVYAPAGGDLWTVQVNAAGVGTATARVVGTVNSQRRRTVTALTPPA